MYTHKVVIVRSDTSNPFYYDVAGVLNDPFYINLSEQAKTDGKMISENLTVSSDGLILERTVVWDSEQSFTDFLNQWLAHSPNHRTAFQTYSQSVGHYAMLGME
jgi:hypothetical protein